MFFILIICFHPNQNHLEEAAQESVIERIVLYPEKVENGELYDSFIHLETKFQSLGFYSLSLNEL